MIREFSPGLLDDFLPYLPEKLLYSLLKNNSFLILCINFEGEQEGSRRSRISQGKFHLNNLMPQRFRMSKWFKGKNSNNVKSFQINILMFQNILHLFFFNKKNAYFVAERSFRTCPQLLVFYAFPNKSIANESKSMISNSI